MNKKNHNPRIYFFIAFVFTVIYFLCFHPWPYASLGCLAEFNSGIPKLLNEVENKSEVRSMVLMYMLKPGDYNTTSLITYLLKHEVNTQLRGPFDDPNGYSTGVYKNLDINFQVLSEFENLEYLDLGYIDVSKKSISQLNELFPNLKQIIY